MKLMDLNEGVSVASIAKVREKSEEQKPEEQEAEEETEAEEDKEE